MVEHEGGNVDREQVAALGAVTAGGRTQQLLDRAARLSNAVAGKMAHALGWPRYTTTTWSGVRWTNPHRNYYCANAGDVDWEAAERDGFAQREKSVGLQQYWTVTELGMAVLRTWLLARRLADQVPGDQVPGGWAS